MKKRYLIKKSAKNYFSAATGIKAIQLTGSSNCLIVEQATVARIPKLVTKPVTVSKLAYSISSGEPIENIKNVTHSCGVDQCVNPDHFVADLLPSGWKS